MADSGVIQTPSTLDELKTLILQLYHPTASQTVAKTQEALQKLQRSSEGWQLANSLLGSQEQSVRFFGALTFTVKLNTDSGALSEDDAKDLLQTLLGWVVQLVERNESALVMRKLCSTLVAYFLQFSELWPRCIKHLMCCLCVGRVVSYHAMDDTPETSQLIENITSEKAIIVFWFASNLVEEVGKTDASSMKQHKFHARLAPNADDIVPLIGKYISNTSPEVDVKVRQEAMRCFQAWVSYSHRAFIDDNIVLDPLQSLTNPAIMCLVDDNLYETAAELFTEVLENYSKFLRKQDFTLLYSIFGSPWAQQRYERLVQGDYDFDSVQFGLFMLAFGDATVGDLIKQVESDTQSQQLLGALCGLLGAEGFAVHEDKIFVPALEFWSTLVETMLDFTYSQSGARPSWVDRSIQYVLQAIHKCWQKLQFPPPDVFRSWDSVDRISFKDARRDLGDILENVYLLTGIQILDVFIDLSRQSINTGNWMELEASLYCISRCTDCLTNDAKGDEYLQKVFDPSLFSVLANPPSEVPVQTMKTFLALFSDYADYFARHTDILPTALNIAFSAIGSPPLAKSASSAIVKLCSECRSVLIPELSTFIQHLSSTPRASLAGNAKEGILQGISSIIQALPAEDSKVAPLNELINFVDADMQDCLRLISSTANSDLSTPDAVESNNSNYAAATEIGRTALSCLASIAKGMQTPSDKPVNLEEKVASHFWDSGEGAAIQQRILSLLAKAYDALQSRGEIVEAICYVFRNGFVELEPGPFVFPVRYVAQFLVKCGPSTPQLGTVIKTACSLITSHRSKEPINEVIDVLLDWVAQLLQNLGDPNNDPEIAQNGVDFLYRLIPTHIKNLLNYQSSGLEFVFVFTLKALTGSNPLPKFAAVEFWGAFVGLQNEESQSQETIDAALQQLGPLLAKALVYNIGGNAARSELDRLSEPLKKLVVRQVRSQSWLEAALLGDDFPSDKVTTAERRAFLLRIMSLRGARGTNQVVRDFWLASRGSNFAYAS